MPDTHLLVATNTGWQVHCGASTLEAVVPLSLKHRVTCAGCQAWPHPAGMAQAQKKPLASRIASNETILSYGLTPLVGALGRPMNNYELAYYSLLRSNGTVLRVRFEPYPLLLPGNVRYYCDFRVVLWDGSIEWHEVKRRKRGASEAILPHFEDDARVKWKIAVATYTREDERFRLAIGWKEHGAYRWQVEEAKVV